MPWNRAVALLLCCAVSTAASALELGPLQSESALNERFEGRIAIQGATPDDFDTLTVSLASPEQFRRAGIEMNTALFALRFSLHDDDPDRSFVSVTSKEPIREPYLNFLLEVNWADGRLVREYTVLLEPAKLE